MSKQPIRIGTRGSKLALWQAHYVADCLKEAGHPSEIITIETKGDKVLDVSIAKIGSKGVFTEEIEDQLQQGTIDIAVHSAKDMQSVLPTGFELIAFTEREGVEDVILSHKEGIDISDSSKSLVLGTSSARRVATLRHFYPHVKTVEIRGNLQTRIRKMEEGQCDALLLAYAGVHRMGYDERIVSKLPLKEFIPAVGQGSVAVEASLLLDPAIRQVIREHVNHPESEVRLLAERSFLRRLEGGCSIPAFALAYHIAGALVIEGGLVSLDGKERIVRRLEGSTEEAEALGLELAEAIIALGGDRILKEIKAQQAATN